MKPLLLSIPLLFGFACTSSTSSSATTSTQTNANGSQEPWFCQAGATDDDWACVQSDTLAAAPKPSRLPARREPTPAVIDVPARSSRRPTPTTPPVTARPAPAPPPPALPAQPAADPTDVPRYVELSYQPDKPMSILDLPQDFWAVQIVALSSKEALEQYAEENNIRGMSAARIWNGQQLFYILLLGIYETRENAEDAIASLGPPFDIRQPWIRSVGSLQEAMLDANREAGTAEI